ncbi:MAG: arsenate reductase ArsC [Rhodobacteraceae bacterium]|nr:arsenate reductase ArsC [Paracoccaceae bacterium]
MTDKSFNILFLCSGNSARSLIAEAIVNQEIGGSLKAYSAGSDPRPEPHPLTVDTLKRLKFDTGFARSKDWFEFTGADAPRMDFVITVCDPASAESCPVWPGHPLSANWGVPDPVLADGSEAERRQAFEDTFRTLRSRIKAFAALPLATLDREALKHKMDAIGNDLKVAK